MENEILLKAIENMLDKKLDPINKRLDSIEERLDNIEVRLDNIEGRIENLEKGQEEIKSNQQTILEFVTEADTEFLKLQQKTREIDKIKSIININNIKEV